MLKSVNLYKNEFTEVNMGMINSLIGAPFHNKKLAEHLTKEWLRNNSDLTYFIEKDRYSTIYKCKRKDDLLFHIIIKQNEEIEPPVEIRDENDLAQMKAAEKCHLMLFIYKGKENEFKEYAYNLLEIMINHTDLNV